MPHAVDGKPQRPALGRLLDKEGSTRGGVLFRKGALAYLLRNRVYIGDVVHQDRYFAQVAAPPP